jgi:membrane-associated protease RseP (regulator of RpoE activity)
MLLLAVTLLICITAHELAHFIAAKLVKCKVEVFSIGLGRAIYSKKIGNTKYQLSWIPFGGYNKLKAETEYSRSKYAFTNLRYSKKVIITVAGCFINVVMGAIAIYYGLPKVNYSLCYFGLMSIALGLTNMLPIPALDGSYLIMVWLEKIYGKRRGYAIMNRINSISFKILLVLNIACLPYLIYLGIHHKL